MANIDVLDMNGNKVGSVELSDAIFAIEPNVAARSKRRRKKALEAEGHRSCKTGLNSCSPVDTRRRCFCSEAEMLQIYR